MTDFLTDDEIHSIERWSSKEIGPPIETVERLCQAARNRNHLAAKDVSHQAELEALRERAAVAAENPDLANAINGNGTLCTMAAASTLIAKTIRALPLTEKEAG